VDLGLVSILILAPFLMGGRQALGQMALCLLSTATALAWSLHQCRQGDGKWRFTGVEPIMFLGLGLIFLQCWELSPAMMQALSPRVQRLLSVWDESTASLLPEWNRISFTPAETWSDMVVIVACLEFFFVLVQRLQTIEDILVLLRWIALGGGLMSLLGLVQFAWGNGKFFWVYAHPMTDTFGVAKGAFSNANHFANYLALTVPAAILSLVDRMRAAPRIASTGTAGSRWHMIRARFDLRTAFWGLLQAVIWMGIILSQSRIGMLSASLGVVMTATILWHRSLLTTRQAALGLILLLGIILSAPFINQVPHPIAELGTGANPFEKPPVGSEHRDEVWTANMHGLREFPLAGTGLGSHQEVYWLWFRSPQNHREFSHAENGYLQVALETGITGAGLVALLWLTSLFWCAQGLLNAVSQRAGGVMAVATAGLLMSLVQSLVDFVWYVPACMNIVLLYAVCGWRISLMRFFEPTREDVSWTHRVTRLPRWDWALSLVGFMFLGHWMVTEKLPEVFAEPLWDDYLRVTLAQQRSQPNAEDASAMLNRRIFLALAAAEANPRSHRLQLHAGLACLKQFALNQEMLHRQMPLSQIRDAARSLFDSPEEMHQWLSRPGVLGSEQYLLREALEHFQASLEACPLQPRPYLELAELVWLRGGSERDERRLIEQAVAVRPCDARSHFALGRALWLEGNQKEAAAHWQDSFHYDPDYRGHLISVLAEYVPARFFLDHFDPDYAALKQLREAYRSSDDVAGYQLVLESLARSSAREAVKKQHVESVQAWMLAHECFAELGDRKAAYNSGREAIAADPSSFAAHQTFGLWLYRTGMFAEAVRELSWCARNHPEEHWLNTIASDARHRLNQTARKTEFAEEPVKTLVR
jgi:tetratricopeptide (TPR) repeat protein